MARANIKCVQINLHHAKGASSILSRRVVKDNRDVSFIQEPCVAGGRIKGISTQSYKLIYNTEHERPRAALLIHKTSTAVKTEMKIIGTAELAEEATLLLGIL